MIRPKNYFQKGKECFNNKSFDEALYYFYHGIKESSESDIDKKNCFNYYIYLLLLKSKYKELAKIFKKINNIEDFGLYTLYWFKFMTGELDVLYDIIERMLNSENYFLRVFAIFQLYKNDKIQDINDYIKKHVNYFGLTYNLNIEEQRASILIDAMYNRYQLAFLEIKSLLKDSPLVTDIFIDIFEILNKIDSSNNIVLPFNKNDLITDKVIVKFSESDYRIKYFLAKEFYNIENYDKSKEYLIFLLKIFKNNPLFHYNLANNYYKKKNLNRAMNEYEIAISLAPLFEKAYYNLGTIYYRKGLINDAIACFRESYNIGRNLDSLYNLSVSLLEKKELIDAYDNFNKIPDNMGNIYNKSQICSKIKEIAILI